MRIFYVPLEPMEHRYTAQWSRAETGWIERDLRQTQITYHRIEGVDSSPLTNATIYDPSRRFVWATSQIKKLMDLLPTMKADDFIFFDDFWHPGIEQLKMLIDMTKSPVKLCSFCHAQSVDVHDFTHKMVGWIRPIEQGLAHIYDIIFVNNHLLKELLTVAFPSISPNKIAVCGHVYSVDEVLDVYPEMRHERFSKRRSPVVAFSSRLDSEKNPKLLLATIINYITNRETYPYQDLQFRILSGTEITSDDKAAIDSLRHMAKEHPEHVVIYEHLTKAEYYKHLTEAAVQLSTSKQDWISFCLLEAVTAGCVPVYPMYRSYIGAFGLMSNELYTTTPHNINQAPIIMNKIIEMIMHRNSSKYNYFEWFNAIVETHDATVVRMLNVMRHHLGVDRYT